MNRWHVAMDQRPRRGYSLHGKRQRFIVTDGKTETVLYGLFTRMRAHSLARRWNRLALPTVAQVREIQQRAELEQRLKDRQLEADVFWKERELQQAREEFDKELAK